MKIALTFDIERDIPHVLDTYFGLKEGIPKILDLLEEYSLKCTFFCTGLIAKKFPELIQLIESKDHEIACHGLNHERLTKLTIDRCQEIISENKMILEEVCSRSEIIGFRAPYLKPPDFIFKILYKLGFKYDSSFKSNQKIISNPYSIREFHPLNISLRMPFGYKILKRRILKNDLITLYYHSIEILNVKKLMTLHKKRLNLFRDYLLRPDRWFNTGDKFIKKINMFIKFALLNKVEFITLKDLIKN